MINKKLRIFLSAVSLFSVLMMTTSANAAPIKFSQVVQIVNAKPGKASTGSFSQLRVVKDDNLVAASGNNDGAKPSATPPADGRVIVETRSDIIEDEACDCPIPPTGGGFPKYALLGLAAIPIGFLIFRDKDTPTPTPTVPTTQTPTPPTTETPTPTQTMTPTPTPTLPPPMTPTPEPVPEPVTILLFGTGLAGIGVAARKRLRRKDQDGEEGEEGEEQE